MACDNIGRVSACRLGTCARRNVVSDEQGMCNISCRIVAAKERLGSVLPSVPLGCQPVKVYQHERLSVGSEQNGMWLLYYNTTYTLQLSITPAPEKASGLLLTYSSSVNGTKRGRIALRIFLMFSDPKCAAVFGRLQCC